MDPQLFILMMLRSVGLLANLQGQQKLAGSLSLIADAALSGLNIDAHMKAVGEALAGGREPDLSDLRRRIEEESARLQR